VKRYVITPSAKQSRGRVFPPVHLLLVAFALLTAITAAAPAAALAAPSATTNPATKVHHTSAVLSGSLDPGGDPGITECRFEWGATVAYGNIAPCNEGNSFAAPADVRATVTNLTPGATYHYRLEIETTSSGPINGVDQSFRPNTFPITRGEIAAFGPDGTSASSFSETFAIAFSQATRKLFALDRKASSIYGFDASSPPAYAPLANFNPLVIPGPPGDQPDIAVDGTASASAGNVYYVSESGPLAFKIYGYGPGGSPLAGFPVTTSTGRSCGAAVDSSGHLWVANHVQTIEELSSTGALLDLVETPDQGQVCKLAFDTNDDMYVASQNGDLWKYTAASDYASSTEFAPRDTNNVAVDPSTHNVYVGHYAEESEGRYPGGTRVDEYDSAGHFLGEFALGIDGNHVAVDGVTHNVFVTGNDGKIHVFGGPETTFKLPTVTTGQASAITGSTATLGGAVDPEGMPVTECHIAWGASQSYGNEIPCSPSPGSGSGDVAVSAEISGLTSGTQYHFRVFASNAEGTNAGQDVAFTTNFPPAAAISPVTNVTDESADLNGLVNPKGFPTTYRFEWGPTPAYGNSVPVPSASAGSGEGDVPVSGHIAGLAPNSRYHWRLVAESLNGSSATEDASFVTLGAPIVETTGAPIRTTISAQLGGRVSPRGFATSYYFEYGDQGPCDSSPCTATPTHSAGSEEFEQFVSEEITELQRGTTYHYRIVADNGQPGSPVFGEDMTVTTYSSEAPLTHGHVPGPPGSDRAWELVSAADAGGNSVNEPFAISDDGGRVVYGIGGGAPFSDTGAFNEFAAKRTSSGWQTEKIYPVRAQLAGPNWQGPSGPGDLSSFVALNFSLTGGGFALFRMSADAPAVKLFEVGSEHEYGFYNQMSDDGSRALMAAGVSSDPEFPVPPDTNNVYDVTSGSPHLANLLPGNVAPTCGFAASGSPSPYVLQLGGAVRASHWLSADGNLFFFGSNEATRCSGNADLYVRDFAAAETKRISGPALSGPDCGAGFIKSNADAAFFWTKSRLAANDTAPVNCTDETADGDIYRYQLNDGSLRCVTCVIPDVDADVFVGSAEPATSIAVAEDGSRIYFRSASQLLPGAQTPGLYRIDVESGHLAYVASADQGFRADGSEDGAVMTPDGSVLIFSSSEASLNPLGGGAGNAGTHQLYRYDDGDRSLVCISCPRNGEPPRGDASGPGGGGVSPNHPPISRNGTFAFSTPTSLVDADQNTAPPGHDSLGGSDAYEWRDNGRVLLVSDGRTNWAGFNSAPRVKGMSPSGQDIIFTAATQYTPDALDDFRRLYDARIGGGFEFAKPPPPCPLEVCQGTPKGAPDEPPPGTSSFSGPGNSPAKKSHHKKSHHKKTKKHTKHRANHKRRTAR
jgi:hypothetical protein